MRAHQFNTVGNGLHGLRAGHGRAKSKIRRAGGDAAIDRPGHRCPGNAHIHGHDRAVGSRRHAADAGAASRQILQHGAGHAGVRLADTLGHHAVVGTQHQHGTAGEGGRFGARQRGGVLDHRFQQAQSTQGLCQRGPVGMRGGAGSLVGRGDGGQ